MSRFVNRARPFSGDAEIVGSLVGGVGGIVNTVFSFEQNKIATNRAYDLKEQQTAAYAPLVKYGLIGAGVLALVYILK